MKRLLTTYNGTDFERFWRMSVLKHLVTLIINLYKNSQTIVRLDYVYGDHIFLEKIKDNLEIVSY